MINNHCVITGLPRKGANFEDFSTKNELAKAKDTIRELNLTKLERTGAIKFTKLEAIIIIIIITNIVVYLGGDGEGLGF